MSEADFTALEERMAQALRDRRALMFGDHITLAGFGFDSLAAWPCNECGDLVVNQDAHFGFHCKLDNIDGRVITIERHH